MRKENSEFKTKFISESGSYLRNADYFAFVELKDYACYCVADGIDTDEKRESAKLAVTAVITAFSEEPGISKNKLKHYLNTAHHTLHQEAQEIRLEASIIIVVTDYKNVRWGHAGNCRLVAMRNGRIKFRTKDMSLSQNLADKSEISLDQLESHEERHNLFCYLGQSGHFNPRISGKKKLDDGDMIFLYTRGVWEAIGDAELLDSTEGVSDPEKVCTNIEDIILSRQQGIIENYTIVSIFVDKVYRNPKASKNKKYLKIVFSICMAIGMMAGMFCFTRYRSNQKNITQMQKLEERGVKYLNEINYTAADEQFDAAVELADKVRVSEKSEAYQHVKKIELYHAIAGYMTESMEAVGEGEYKKASNKIDAAIDSAKTLETEHGEKADYLSAMESYKDYADNMKNGTDALEAQNYEQAVQNFTAASKATDSIDDTTNRNVADEKLNTANGKKALKEGAVYEANAEALLEQNLYNQALTEYNTALEMYTLAKENYNEPEADSKISFASIKIDNINETINKQSNQEMEKEADSYVQKANQAMHSGDFEEAQECYESAKEIYQKTENTAQLVAINEKLENVAYGPDEQNALQNVLDGMLYMSSGDYATAIEKLESAKEAYNNMGDTSSANAVANTITALMQKQSAVQE